MRKRGLVLRCNRLGSGLRLPALVLASSLVAAPAMASDDGGGGAPVPLSGLLETLDIKAKPAGPAPDFVERTRPDPARLHYLPPAMPHTVSPIKVKTPAEIEAQKAALDAAQTRQLNPAPPVELKKPVRATAGKRAGGRSGAQVKPAAAPD